MRKHVLPFLLCFALILPLSACGGSQTGSGAGTTSASNGSNQSGYADQSVTEPEKPDDSHSIPANEFARALWYGFLPDTLADTDPDTAVTWKQYCAMLGEVISLLDKSRLPEWETMTAEAPDTAIQRDGAAIANLFAAKVAGLDYCNRPAGEYRDESYSYGHHFSYEYPVFDWEKPYALRGQNTTGEENAIAAAYWYNLGRCSCISAEPLLTCDESGDPHLEDVLTLRDALVSVTRLYESVEDVAIETAEKLLSAVLETEEGRALTAEVDQRKVEILRSPSTIAKSDEFHQGETYTGTAYYVSNNGDDGNDGLTPETPFATLERLGEVSFSYGDAVFFERGSIWRKAVLPASLVRTEGITLSAYGDGDKPGFYSSSENGSGADKWSLFYSGENGEKIWKFYHEITDCPAMVGPDDTLIAVRDLFYWDGTEICTYEDTTRQYDMTEQLENGELFVDLPYEESEDPEHMYVRTWDNHAQQVFLTGPLYVRLDEGNPGELYDSIEFLEAYSFENGIAEYGTMDNLDIRYGNTVGLGGATEEGSWGHVTCQNCVISWCGGHLNFFRGSSGSHSIDTLYGSDQPGSGEADGPDAFLDGGGLNTSSFGTIRDCYVHHCYQEGLALETFAGDTEMYESITITGNVSEYCMFGMVAINWDTVVRDDHLFKNIAVTDNYVMYSGFKNYYCVPTLIPQEDGGYNADWTTAMGTKIADATAFNTTGPNASDGSYKVTNNTFAFSTGNLIKTMFYYEEYFNYLDKNTYAQLPGFGLFEISNFNTYEHKGNRHRFLDPETAMAWLHDDNATVITFGEDSSS